MPDQTPEQVVPDEVVEAPEAPIAPEAEPETVPEAAPEEAPAPEEPEMGDVPTPEGEDIAPEAPAPDVEVDAEVDAEPTRTTATVSMSWGDSGLATSIPFRNQ